MPSSSGCHQRLLLSGGRRGNDCKSTGARRDSKLICESDKEAEKRTCCTGSGTSLKNQRSSTTSCSMNQNGIARCDGINTSREDHGCEALKQCGACQIQGHSIWNLDATAARHRHKLSVRGITGGQACNSVTGAQTAV